mgnify:CR=1 FL=1
MISFFVQNTGNVIVDANIYLENMKNYMKVLKLIFFINFLGLPLKSLYLNHNTHMLNYIKYLLDDSDEKETQFEKNFYMEILEENRKIFCKKLNLDYNENNIIEIEKLIKQELNNEEYVGNGNNFMGDRSYNMSDNYNFRQLIYFEYLAPFLKRNERIQE